MFQNDIWNTSLRCCGLVVLLVCWTEAVLREWDGIELDCNFRYDNWIPQVQVPMGTPWRALKTLPPGLKISNSSIPNAGLGVFSDVFIRRFTWLGAYEGEIVINENDSSVYAWEIWRGDKLYYFLDGHDERTSSWLRYVNCARNWREENVVMLQCYDTPYYVTVRDVFPGEELLVYYGDDDALRLGVDLDTYFDGY